MTAVATSKPHHHQLFPSAHHHSLVQPSRPHYVCADPLIPATNLNHPPPPLLPHSSSPLLFSTINKDCSSSREDSVSDSEISSISDSSELRALFTTLRNLNSSSPTPGTTTTTATGCYNQLKIKEDTKVGERTRRLLHRPSHFESDSSSSLAESCESLTNGGRDGSKQEEREHYDKLKLNLANLSGNKKAISGLRVLYRDPPCGYRHLHSPISSPSSSSSSLLLHHHPHHRRPGHQGIFHQKSASEMAPRTKYWSEGHTNKIHSVNLDPIRSKSLSWRQEEASRMTSPQRERSVTPTHTTPVFRRRSLSETRSYDVVVASSSSPRRQVSRAGSQKSSKSTENISQQVSTFFRHSPARRSFSARGRIQNGEIRERAYTDIILGGSRGRRGSFSADKRRSVKTSCSELDTDRTSGSISFILSPVILKYEGEELEYHSREHNFSIKIPKGAVKKPATVEIQVGLAIHGPFVFPENSRNASPILWLCSIPDTKFRKPIHITLPHCIAEARSGSLKRRKYDEGVCLQFASASLKPASSKSRGRREFEFSPADGEEEIHCGPEADMSGAIATKHLSPLCIVASCGKMNAVMQEMTLHAVYCIVPVIPITVTGRQWSIHFCITFDLPTCVQALRNYFTESEFQLMPPHAFKFAPPTIDEWEREGDPELEIRFPRKLPESGWRLALESERKISSSSVSFSPCRRSNDHTLSLTSSINSSLTASSSSSSPSAMFTISVDGTSSQREAVTCVSFVGSVEPITVKISLPLTHSHHDQSASVTQHPQQQQQSLYHHHHHQQQGAPGYDHLPLSPPASSSSHTANRS